MTLSYERPHNKYFYSNPYRVWAFHDTVCEVPARSYRPPLGSVPAIPKCIFSVAQYGNLRCASLGHYWHCLWGPNIRLRRPGCTVLKTGQCGLMVLSVRPKHAGLGSHRCCIKNSNRTGLYANLRHDGMFLPWLYIFSLVVPVWVSNSTTFLAKLCLSGYHMSLHF